MVVMVIGLISSVIDLITSPLTGAANAQQMHDTYTSYAIARFVSQHNVNLWLYYVAVAFLILIWRSVLFPARNKGN